MLGIDRISSQCIESRRFIIGSMTMSPSPTPAETYEAFMVPFRFRPWAEALFDHVDVPAGARVLDLACGTGIVARVAATRLQGSGTITGVDMNPAMIEVARSASAAEHLEIDWQVGLAGELPFPDASFDLVTIQQGLQFFPDKPTALRDCLRVLVPGGLLAVEIWSALEKQGVQKAYAEAIERVTGTPSMHAPYGTTTAQQMHDLIAGAGFVDVSVDEVTIQLSYDNPGSYAERMLQGTSAGVPTMHGRSDEERAELAKAVTADMAHAVAAATVGNYLVTDSTTFIATGRKPAR
jgi:ubiquinone/menaquinone biosynthesis C-methylase UbiE